MRFRAKHFFCKIQQHLTQVCKRHIFINIQSLYLVEEAVCTCGNRLIAIYTTRTQHTDWWLLTQHCTCLYARSVRTKQNIAWFLHTDFLLDKERILHIACRMLWGKIQKRIYVLIILHFWSFRHCKTYTRKNINYLLTHQRQWMTCTQLYWIRSTCQIHIICRFTSSATCLHYLTQLIDSRLCSLTQTIQRLTNQCFLLFWHRTKLIKQLCNDTFLRKIFNTQTFHFFKGSSLKSFYLLQ